MVYAHSPSWASLCYVWLTALLSAVNCQVYTPYQDLPSSSPYISDGGSFVWPSGTTQQFDEGAPMTIRWTSTYEIVNIYAWYYDGNEQNAPVQFQINTGISGTSYDWNVTTKEYGYDYPWTLHIVNAQGTDDELRNGGFWSRLIWIRPSATATSSSSTSTTSSTTTSSTTSTTSSETSTSAATVTVTASTPTESTSNTSGGGSSTTAIGVGVGVGLGVALLLAAGFFFVRRHLRSKRGKGTNGPQAHPQSVIYSDATMSPQPELYKGKDHQAPSEAPGWRTEPQELPSPDPRTGY